MKNALILHGTDFHDTKNQRNNNWFPWLKRELESLGYQVWLPELPQARHPDLKRYWDFVKDFDFNGETILVGHSSGGAAVFGLLHKLPEDKKVKLTISVAGFYRDEGWGCEGLFSENYNWEKIKKQAKKIVLVWSLDDPYISKEQTEGSLKKERA
jgi:predicted alpha/beta hydrolase family esterase